MTAKTAGYSLDQQRAGVPALSVWDFAVVLHCHLNRLANVTTLSLPPFTAADLAHLLYICLQSLAANVASLDYQQHVGMQPPGTTCCSVTLVAIYVCEPHLLPVQPALAVLLKHNQDSCYDAELAALLLANGHVVQLPALQYFHAGLHQLPGGMHYTTTAHQGLPLLQHTTHVTYKTHH